MVPYYGRHGLKQHIYGKPIRFGYKVWCLCTTEKYLIQTEPYQGAGTNDKIEDLGMGGSVVSYLISELPYTNNYCLFFDNLFTSLPLMKHLNERDYSGTGTRRVARNSQLGGLIRGSGGLGAKPPAAGGTGALGRNPSARKFCIFLQK